MKKIAKYFFAALAVASAVSCAKELTDDFRPADKVQQGKSYTFTATMADTKSVIDEETLEILWMGDKDGKEYITVLQPATDLDVAPDKIDAKAILYSASDIYEPTSFAQFSQDNEKADGIEGNVVYAVYPSANWKVFEGKDKEDETKIVVDSVRVIADYAAIQKPVAGTYDPKAPVAVAYNADIETSQDLHFMNTSALLKLQFTKTTGTVNSVKIIALGGEKISGEMLVLGIEDGAPVLVPTDAAKSHVEMVATEADGFEKGATYYIAVAPAVLSQGVALQFNEDEVQTYTVSGEIVIERGKVYDLGTFSCEEPEDAWYLVGDYNVGNANSIRKASFVEVEGKDFLVAKNVTIADGQGFKVYNPKQGVVLYPEVTDLEKNEWFPLTKDAGYGYAAMSYETYDVYVEYINKEMTGLILVEAGAAVPEFATPAESLYAFYNEIDMTNYYVNIEADAITIGYNYDEFVAATWANSDPSMEGKWGVERKITDFTVTPTDAMSGSITFSTVEVWGPAYWMIQYSNCHRGSVVFKSQEMDLGIPAEGGENYWGIGGTVAWGDTWTVSDEEVLFAYPTPSGLFVSRDEVEGESIIDLGSVDSYTFRYGKHVFPEIADDEVEFYNFWGVNGDPYCQVAFTGDINEIIPTDNTSGEIVVKSKGDYYKIYYTDYKYNYSIQLNSPADIDGPVLDENGEQMEDWEGNKYYWNGLGLEMIEPAYVAESTPRFISYEIPAEMPDAASCDTPDGDAYTWFDESYNADLIVDFGNVIEKAIVKAYNYSQAMIPEGGEEWPIEEIWWNPELAGSWVSQGEVYSDYTVMPTSDDSGVITFVKEGMNMWGEPVTQYMRIVYSDLTDKSVMLFSPSTFNEYPVYDTETGEPVMNEMYGMPYYWEGIGLMQFDEDWNSLPVEVTLADEIPSIYVEDSSKMTPDEAQWVFYDPAVAEYFVGVSQMFEGAEARTLLNLGASDLSWMAGPDFAGSFIHIAVSYEDLFGEAAAGVWMAANSFGLTTPYEVIPSDEDPSSGTIVLKSAGMSEGLDLEEEGESSMAIKYTGYNPYGGICYFDFSAFGLEGEYMAFITPTKDLMAQ